MKKWLCICLSLFMLFVVSCTAPSLPTTSLPTTQTTSMTTSITASPTKMDLLNVAMEYQAKIAAILEADGSSLPLEEEEPKRSRMLSVVEPFDPERLIPRETFEAVYANQIQNSNHVYLGEFLMFYQTALDIIIEGLKTASTNEAEVVIFVEWMQDMFVFARVSLTEDQSILVRFEVIEELVVTQTTIKFGYEDDRFMIRMLNNVNSGEQIQYFEFLEDHSIVSFMVNQEDLYYQYINQVDETNFLYGKEPDFFLLRWFNPVTMLRTTLQNRSEIFSAHIEQFNQKGIVFEYGLSEETDEVYVAWQLLEADGWNAAYMTDSGGPHKGVYLDGVRLPIQARQYNVDMNPFFANVRMDMYIPIEDLTDEILSLQAFGLSFRHPEFTIAQMQTIMDGVMEESLELQSYRGIDFTGENLRSQFFEVIDADLLPKND